MIISSPNTTHINLIAGLYPTGAVLLVYGRDYACFGGTVTERAQKGEKYRGEIMFIGFGGR